MKPQTENNFLVPWIFQSFLLQCFCISIGGLLDLPPAGMINLIYVSHELIAIKEHIYIRDQEAIFNGKGGKEVWNRTKFCLFPQTISFLGTFFPSFMPFLLQQYLETLGLNHSLIQQAIYKLLNRFLLSILTWQSSAFAQTAWSHKSQ